MKKLLVSGFILFVLAGCGQNDAQDDYERCNDEYASGTECTKEEFKDWLIAEEEYNSMIPLSDRTSSNQEEFINEMNDKIDEIF